MKSGRPSPVMSPTSSATNPNKSFGAVPVSVASTSNPITVRRPAELFPAVLSVLVVASCSVASSGPTAGAVTSTVRVVVPTASDATAGQETWFPASVPPSEMAPTVTDAGSVSVAVTAVMALPVTTSEAVYVSVAPGVTDSCRGESCAQVAAAGGGGPRDGHHRRHRRHRRRPQVPAGRRRSRPPRPLENVNRSSICRFMRSLPRRDVRPGV